MKIDFNHEIENLYRNEPYLRPFFEDCLEINTTKDKIQEQVFFILMHGGSTYSALKKKFPEMTNDELTKSLDKIIKLTGIDVNQPCWAGNQDLMYHAMRFGTVDDVKMLLRNGYDGSNLMSNESMFHNFNNWPAISGKDEKLKTLKLYGIGDYGCLSIKENLKNAKKDYLSEINLMLNLQDRLYGKEISEEKRKEDVDFYLKNFEYYLKEVESLVKELEGRGSSYDKCMQLMRNQKVCIPYKLSENSELIDTILTPFVQLNKEKATTKLFSKLLELNTSLEDIIDIFKGNICSYDPASKKDILRPAYKKLLDSENLKYYNPYTLESEDDVELE